MIGNSGNINPNNYDTHKHEVTKCLHETRKVKPGGGGAPASGTSISVPRIRQEQKDISLRELLADGLRGLFTKVSGFWAKQGMHENRENPAQEEKGKTLRAVMAGKDGERGLQVSAVENAAAGILATSMVKPDTKREEEQEETAERKVKQVEGAVSGGLKKGQGGIQKFLQKFGEAAAKAGRLFKREKRNRFTLSENNTDLEMGNNSFLLDSYNRMGEYSSLAKDRSLEGNFKAEG